MASQIQWGCATIKKTGTTEGQGAGQTRNAAIRNGATDAYNKTALPGFPSCAIICPVRKISPLEAVAFTVTEEGEFDVSSPNGPVHLFYVRGTLEWSITRTCSKLKLLQLRIAAPKASKATGKRAKRPGSR